MDSVLDFEPSSVGSSPGAVVVRRTLAHKSLLAGCTGNIKTVRIENRFGVLVSAGWAAWWPKRVYRGLIQQLCFQSGRFAFDVLLFAANGYI